MTSKSLCFYKHDAKKVAKMNVSVVTFVAETIAMSLVSMTGLRIMVSSMEGLRRCRPYESI